MRIEQAVAHAHEVLARAGIEEPLREAFLLVSECIGQERAWVMAHPDAEVSPKEQKRLACWLRRRARREPLAYITRHRWFYGLNLTVGRGVLIPRPETETLVETFLEWTKQYSTDKTPLLVDVGVGSGAVMVACLWHAPEWHGVGTEVSWRAIRIAKRNCRKFALSRRAWLVQTRWLDSLQNACADAVLSNPPYVLPDEWANLAPEIRLWEPQEALLVASDDPLNSYRSLSQSAWRVLKPEGLLAVETSPRLVEKVVALLQGQGYQKVQVVPDLAGHPRVVKAER